VSLIRSYALWNNKGGVGKSTITFHLASRYAETHPKQDVLVLDLCPQANASMMLLGGGTSGEERVLDLCTKPIPKTVVGYLSSVIAGGAGAPLPNPKDFVIRVADFNSDLPKNLYLLCGDGNLEPMAPAISAAAAAPALTPTAQPWKWVHRVPRALVEDVAEKSPAADWMVFIDTNPSFSIYTELAVSAADRLLTPVNADDSSRVATSAMFILLHGQVPPHPVYGSWTFAAQAVKHNLPVPQIHLVIGNRLTQYGGAATAFRALSDATADSLYHAFKARPQDFTPRAKPIKSVGDFRDRYSVALRDFNTAGVVAAHLGRRLSGMEQTYYTVHGESVKVNLERIKDCLEALDEVVAFVD
jgi:hypothetical protein